MVNWTECPKVETHNTYKNPEFKLLFGDTKKYGDRQSLREDFEFYLLANILSINYSCECNICGFKFIFNKKVDVLNEQTKEN